MCRQLICSVALVWVLGMVLMSTAKADLVGWWKLDEGSGSTASDASGKGTDLTLNGDPQWVAGRIGGALEFDGNDEASAATVSRVLRPAPSITVSAWVKADPATSGWSWVAGQGDNYGLVVNRDDDNDVHFYIHTAAGWSGVGSGDVGILDGKWHHIAGVFDAADGSLYVYKDMKVPYPAHELKSAWKHTCFSQFHDVFAGVSVNSTYPEVRARFAVIKGIAQGQRDRAIQVVARGIHTKDLQGMPVVVLNPLGWRRSDVVKVEMPAYQLPKGKLAVKDPDGKLHPVQLVDQGGQGRNAVLLFVAHDVPSMGYKTYALQADEQVTSQGLVASQDGSMENQFFRARLDMKTGNLASLKLKQANVELIPKGKQANVLLLQNEDPKVGFMSSWNIKPIGKPWHLEECANVELVESGPVRSVYRITHKYKNSTFTRDLAIYAELPRLDIEMAADWHGRDLWVRVLLPTAVENGRATFHVPYGAKVTLPRTIKSVKTVNLLENEMDEDVSVHGRQIEITTKPYQIKSLRISL